MEQLHEVALLGTGRRDGLHLDLDADLDSLLAGLTEDNSERRLLIAAGALSIWEQAGYAPSTVPPIEEAPAETLKPCSQRTADILRSMLQGGKVRSDLFFVAAMERQPPPSGLPGDHGDLLPEALALLQRRGQRLRHAILPDFLPARSEPLRQALVPVLGERGCWLARFNPVWSWALPTRSAQDALTPEMEKLWKEGTPAQRLEALRQYRRIDSAAARSWVEAVFASERFETRAQLVGALEIGLSPEDEAFLERALDDRHMSVRRRAATVLARLPDSACAQRLRRRADDMLITQVSIWKKGHVGARLPAALNPEWRREGLDPSFTMPGLDVPGTWLLQTVGLVPVHHWIERFGQSLEELIAALRGDRAQEILEAWTQAALLHQERDLLPALWDGWRETRRMSPRYADLLPDVLGRLAGAMDTADATPRLVALLLDPPTSSEVTVGRVLDGLSYPWPDGLAEAFIDVLRDIVVRLSAETELPQPWIYVLIPAACRLPPSYLSSALQLLPSPRVEEPRLQRWQTVLDFVMDKLQIRQRLLEELTI